MPSTDQDDIGNTQFTRVSNVWGLGHLHTSN